MGNDRSAVTPGKGFFSNPSLSTFGEQLFWLSGWAHGAAEAEEASDHVHMTVLHNDTKYEITDTGFDFENNGAIRFKLRQQGGSSFGVVAVMFNENLLCYEFIPPTTEESLEIMTALIEQGEWSVDKRKRT